MASFNYSFQTGQGLNPYLLKSIKDIVGTENAPSLKIDNIGLLNLLKSQKQTLQVNRPSAPGGIEFVQVKTLQRFTPLMTGQSDTCGSAVISPYLESTVALNGFRQVGIYIEDALIQEYTDDCLRTSSLGLPPTAVMGEMLEQIYAAANGLLVAVDQDLMNMVAYGTNVRTGNANSATLNITQTTTTLPLADGLTQLLTDCQINEFATGKPQIFGSGLFLNFMNQQNAKGLAENGLNTSIEAMGVNFFYDQQAASILGTNEIVAVSPDSIQLVEFARYTGPMAGRKGISDFGSFVLPMQMTPNHVVPVQFDYQLRYLDCPAVVANVDDYYGNPISGYRGWEMIISKKFGLYQIPTNAYRAGDFLYGTNGTLRYTITNS